MKRLFISTLASGSREKKLGARTARQFLLFLFLITTTLTSHAQWFWVNTSSGSGTPQPISCSTTAGGLTFVCGGFYNSHTFGSTTLTDPGNVGGGFLTRLNTNGSIAWAVGMTGSLDEGAAAVVANGTDVFVSGAFSGTTTIGTTSGSPVTVTGSGLSDNFYLARYNSSGVLQWVQTLLGNYGSGDIEINPTLQRIYVIAGSLVCCYDYNGVLQWSTPVSSSGTLRSGGLAVDATGNVHLMYSFSGTLTLPGASFTATTGQKLVLIKLDGSGTYVTGSAIGQGTSAGFAIRPEDLEMDFAGNLYLAGDFQQGTLILSGTSLPNSGGLDGFLAKYTSSYGLIGYTKTNGAAHETITALCVDNSANAFIAINNIPNNTLSFNCYPSFVSAMGSMDQKLLIAKYSTTASSVTLDWIMTPQVTDGATNMFAMSTNGNGSVIATGKNVSNSVFGTTPVNTICAYFTRVQGTSVLPVAHNAVICSGNTATVSVTGPAGATFNWYAGISSPTPFHTGTSYTTGVITTSGPGPGLVTFYVSNSLCSGTRIPVTVTVNPTPNLSSVATNVTVCGGNCVTIGQLTPEAGVTYAIYNSTSGTSVLIASSSSVSVCPKKPSIYTLVATNKYGCSKSITINVNVANNNPSFSLLTTPNSGYFTLSATPTVSYSVANSVPGFGYVWIVEELDDLDNVLFTVYDPLCWQNFSTTPTLVFNGLDDVANSYTGSVTLSSCSTPSVGKFVFGHRYRVTRATWNSYCPWDQYSDEAYPVKNMITGETEMRIVHNVTAPDFSGMFLGNVSEAEPVEEITLYPNPSDGIFTVNMLGDIADQSTVFMIYDIAGRLVTTMNNMGNTVRVDLSGQPSGTYLVHIKTGNRTLVKKVSIVKQ